MLPPLVAGLLAVLPLPASAANYPDHPIRLMIPFAPGGSTDVVGRLLGQALQERLGQPVVVVNESGAGGVIATRTTAQSPPDGYTLLLTTAGHAITASAPDLPYDPIKDFTFITEIASGPQVLVVNPNANINSVEELIAAAKAKPGTINYASAGIGSTSHLAAELFKMMTGTNIVHVPYRGGAPAMADTISGVTQIWFATPATGMPQVERGMLKALGATTAKRSPLLPDMPTIAEEGVPGYEVDYWYGVLGPANMPPETVALLNKTLAEIVQDPKIDAQLKKLGYVPHTSTPEELQALMRKELTKWGDVIQKAGIVIK